jgi:hypothetical protein
LSVNLWILSILFQQNSRKMAHNVSSPYEAFSAAEAFEIARRLEIHYTPKHGAWLNIAGETQRELAAWQLNRKGMGAGAGRQRARD